jgi:hypothetical protein
MQKWSQNETIEHLRNHKIVIGDDFNLLTYFENCSEHLYFLEGEIRRALLSFPFSKNRTKLREKVDNQVLDFNMSGNLTRWEREYNYQSKCIEEEMEDVERIDIKQLAGLWLICGIFLAVGILASFIEKCRAKNRGEDDMEASQNKSKKSSAPYSSDTFPHREVKHIHDHESRATSISHIELVSVDSGHHWECTCRDCT